MSISAAAVPRAAARWPRNPPLGAASANVARMSPGPAGAAGSDQRFIFQWSVLLPTDKRVLCRSCSAISTLGEGRWKDYSSLMRPLLRHVGSLLLALTLVLGSILHGMQATAMDVGMTVAASAQMSGGDDCDRCSADTGMSASECHAVCSLQVAILPVPLSADAAPAETTHSVVPIARIGQTVSPDPFPPKPAIMT